MYGRGGGGGMPFNERKVVYVFGFPPQMDESTFISSITAPLGSIQIDKVNYNQAKLMAFIHCGTHDDAKSIIDHWRGQIMDGGEKPLQVSFKRLNENDRVYNRGGGGGYNMGYGGGNMGYGGGGGGGGRFQKPPQENTVIMKPNGRMMRGLSEPAKDEDEGHDELGYAKRAVQVSGFDPSLTYAKALDIFSNFGPIHMLFNKGSGEFVVRFCYDLSNGYLQNTVNEEDEEKSQGVLGITEKLSVEVLEGTDDWV